MTATNKIEVRNFLSKRIAARKAMTRTRSDHHYIPTSETMISFKRMKTFNIRVFI